MTYFRASGKGGQHRNSTDTAARIKDLKTGLIVECCEERDKLQNHKLAFERMVLKLVAFYKAEYESLHQEKYAEPPEVRVYNEKRSEVKDHRTGKVYDYEDTLDGKLDPILKDFQQER